MKKPVFIGAFLFSLILAALNNLFNPHSVDWIGGPEVLEKPSGWPSMSIAQGIQESAYGGLDPTTARLLSQLIAQHAKTPGKIVLPRRIKPGATLVRQWKGQSHRVGVMQDGFAYDGKTYVSLSEIARLITGSRWNGPRFFGLRSGQE